jgi:hypothetical protein
VPTLGSNIENRVRKLPKPSNHSQALQPLFEAVSNSFFGIEDRFSSSVRSKGEVTIQVDNITNPNDLKIVVVDNGIGLNNDRYDAFCMVDTDFKRPKGGKGVGRLFWLDAFRSIRVESAFLEGTELKKRAFRFELNNSEQIVPEAPTTNWSERTEPGTVVVFEGLRTEDYISYFPKRSDTFLRYFSSHFIADFLVGNGPRVTVDISGELSQYPKAISDLVVGSKLETGRFSNDEFGELSITGFACLPEASTGLDGGHQVHLLADGRTVETRKIDNLLGLRHITVNGHDGLYFHACVSGEYLDKRVNEGRTAFNLPEKTLNALSRHCTEKIKQELILDQIGKYAKIRRGKFEQFVLRHPIYGFDDAETLLNKVPFHATEAEDFASGLVKYQIRRDEERQNAIQGVIEMLEGIEDVPDNFGDLVVKAAGEIHRSEQLALAQHVVRRKLVLELLEKLIRRIRLRDGKEDDFHLEKTLHSFICPMGVRGDDSSEIKSRAHDLWIVDERLAFTRAFSSDKRLDQFIKNGDELRPDLLIWNLAYGMGVTDPEKDTEHVDVSEPLQKMLIVEFKKPGRRNYAKPEDQIELQIVKYISQLKGGEIESFDKQRIRIAPDCVFYCYVIADIVGDLEYQLDNWQTTANGQGRIRPLTNQYRGSIEVVQWQDLVNDAWQRNQATLHAAGLNRSTPLASLVSGKPSKLKIVSAS